MIRQDHLKFSDLLTGQRLCSGKKTRRCTLALNTPPSPKKRLQIKVAASSSAGPTSRARLHVPALQGEDSIQLHITIRPSKGDDKTQEPDGFSLMQTPPPPPLLQALQPPVRRQVLQELRRLVPQRVLAVLREAHALLQEQVALDQHAAVTTDEAEPATGLDHDQLIETLCHAHMQQVQEKIEQVLPSDTHLEADQLIQQLELLQRICDGDATCRVVDGRPQR